MTDLKVVSKKYNDADVLEVSNFEEESAKEVNKVIEEAQSGTINKVLGLNSSGKLVKGDVSGGTQLYLHYISAGSDLDDGVTWNGISIQNVSGQIISYRASYNSIQTLFDDIAISPLVDLVIASGSYQILRHCRGGDTSPLLLMKVSDKSLSFDGVDSFGDITIQEDLLSPL